MSQVRFTWASLEAMAKGKRDVPGVSWATITGHPRNVQTITFGMGTGTYRLQMHGGWDVGPLQRKGTRQVEVWENA
jgi:hypothetical protein